VSKTEEDSAGRGGTSDASCPGVLVVWSGNRAVLGVHRIEVGGELVIGRGLAGVDASDARISRHHARVRLRDGAFAVADLESRNGTFVDGARQDGECWAHAPSMLRCGRTLVLLARDVRPFEGATFEQRDGVVLGPILAGAWAKLARAARSGDGVLLTGESGTGKELAARAYHAATGGTGELIAVNCAAIPATVAERLLFGTRRGAYSGADRDADGYFASADGGTIFLDEIGELDPQVQAKLLRVIETREVLPLGSAKPRRIDCRVVAATLRELRDEVIAGRFREDLYHRVGRPEVRLPALRDRREDIPHLVVHAVAQVAPGLPIHASFVEACLGRPWPGNARELVNEVRRSAIGARDDGAGELRGEALDPQAGRSLAVEEAAAAAPEFPSDEAIARVLEAEHGNVTRAAKKLGVHRNQLRRYLARSK